MCKRNPIQCIIPPYITDELVKSADSRVRSRAIAQIRTAARMRTLRESAQAMPTLMAVLSPNKRKFRQVNDAQQSDQLPGTLIRAEGDAQVGDTAADEAYDGARDTYDMYDTIFQRQTLHDTA